MMKKLIGVVIFMIVFCNSGQAVRIIQEGEIVSWYLHADLVLICNVTHTDTYTISKFDSLVDNGFHLRYNIVREKYQISIDSIIKGEQLIDGEMDTIFTPLFTTQSTREKTEFKELNADGDSVFIGWIEMTGDDFNDYGYFRIESKEKRVVMLRKTEIGYVVDYETACDSSFLAFIQEVKLKGEDYFSFLNPQAVDTLAVYDHYCESMNTYAIDTTIFAYQHDTLSIRNIRSEFCCPRELLALVKNQHDTLVINVVNPSDADCLCDCSYGYTVKIKINPFDSLHLTINNENFTLLKSDPGLSTKYLKDKSVLIYPNPCSDILYISGLQAKRVEITDLNGKTQDMEIQNQHRIDLSCVKPGIYILTIFTDNTIWTEKIIKE